MFLLLLLPLLWGLQRVCIKCEFIVIFNCILTWNAYIVLQHALDVPYEPLILWYYLLFPRTCFFLFNIRKATTTRHEKKRHRNGMLLLHHDISFLIVFYNLFICFIFRHVDVTHFLLHSRVQSFVMCWMAGAGKKM